jgi:CDP-diglyceride synthetase
VGVVDRHDDELAERRAAAGPRRERGGGGATTSSAGGALPLQWADPPEEPGIPVLGDDFSEEAGDDVGPDDPAAEAEVLEMGETIDLTGRQRARSEEDLDVWSDVLRRRPAEAARLTGHPSAAGERIAAAAAARRRRPEPGPGGRETDDEFARALLNTPKGELDGEAENGGAPAPAGNVSRLRPVPEPSEPSRSKGFGSELATRVITGVAMAAGGLLVLNSGPGPASVLVSLIVALGVIELCGALRTQGYRPAGLVALGGSVGLVLGAYHGGESAFAAVGALVVPLTLLWYLAGVSKARPAPGVASTLLVFGYVGIMGGFAGLILARPDGIGLLLGVVLCCVAYDVGGYLAGKRFGRRHIAPSISPNKTAEGLLAGMAASVVIGLVLVGSISPWGRFDALALGVVVAVLAPLGDLCESLLKRDLEVKDLGGLLPGHGGVLDRFDAMLFSLPAVYYLIRLLGVA